jgi:sortase A
MHLQLFGLYSEMTGYMKKLSLALIILGLLVAAFPLMGKLYAVYEQNMLMEEANDFQQTNTSGYENGALEDYIGLQQAFKSEETADNVEIEEHQAQTNENNQESGKAKSAPKPKDKQKLLGVIKIAKIDVNLPIVEGARAANLRVGIGHITGTTALNEVGNSALAGHRSHAFGRFFNRLNELGKGDEIVIQANNKTYKYQVYEKLIVKPDDLSVLRKNKKDRVLTLVTCDPVIGATHRLIVHAIMKDS